ncbi:MAG: glycosyltransferase [Bacteroidota bacterium]
MERKKLLVCTDWFEPAYKAGGPIRSCVNLVEHLSPYYEIYVFTGDRDLRETIPLAGIKINQWVTLASGAKIMYASPDNTGAKNIGSIIQSLDPNFIYLNSVYSKSFTINVVQAHRKIKSKAAIILATRGMLKSSALAIKPLKKKIFFRMAKWMGMHKKIHFHATNSEEEKEIKNLFGNVQVFVADNFPALIVDKPVHLQKLPGVIKLILIGRIHPIKNINYLLEQLKYVTGAVQFSIVGVPEDDLYWQHCETIIQSLPADKEITLIGELPHHLLKDVLAAHHLFVLPTKGENFGHAIAEALGNGRPVLISDQTPWQNLTKAFAGWDCPLSSPACFQKALQEATDWEQSAFDRWCNGALEFALAKQNNTALIQKYLQLFS